MVDGYRARAAQVDKETGVGSCQDARNTQTSYIEDGTHYLSHGRYWRPSSEVTRGVSIPSSLSVLANSQNNSSIQNVQAQTSTWQHTNSAPEGWPKLSHEVSPAVPKDGAYGGGGPLEDTMDDFKRVFRHSLTIYVEEQMMFVSGETAEPSTETTSLIEEIVREQVIEMVMSKTPR